MPAARTLVRRLVPLALLLAAATSATSTADVVDVGENGFTIRSTFTVSAPPAKTYAALIDVAKWWASDHTFSGDAANLSIDPKPQGCWCEKLPGGGGVRHMSVTSVSPGKVIRFEGGLGPLQAMGVAGSLTWKVDASEKGTATVVEVRYVVGGYNPGGFKDLAPAVDGVLKSQLDRFKRYVETGKP